MYEATSPPERFWKTGPRGWLNLSSARRVRAAPASDSGSHVGPVAVFVVRSPTIGNQRSRVNHPTTARMHSTVRHPIRARQFIDQSLLSGLAEITRYVEPFDESSLAMRSIDCTRLSTSVLVRLAARDSARSSSTVE